jgi:hypothetical protein
LARWDPRFIAPSVAALGEVHQFRQLCHSVRVDLGEGEQDGLNPGHREVASFEPPRNSPETATTALNDLLTLRPVREREN